MLRVLRQLTPEEMRQVASQIVPLHPEVARGTLRSILRQSGLRQDQFEAMLR